MATAQDVTVVIACSQQHLPLLPKTLESAEEAGFIIIVLDGYPYTSLDLFRGDVCVMDTHPAIPAGVCHARNIGVFKSHNNLILPLDADDYLLPGAVARMAEAWSPGKVVYGGWTEQSAAENLVKLEDRQAPPPEMLSRKHICHATYLFAKEDWQRVGGYDPDFSIGAEDWAFMIALVNAGCELIRLDDAPLYVKTVNEDGRTHKAIRHKDMIRQLLLEKYPEFMTRS